MRVDDYEQNYTFTYSYDAGGNMEYSYKYVLGSTSAGDLRGVETNSYDSTWKDKLTYSTKVGAITYDAIGNPLKYGNNTLSWTGRQLDSFVGTGTNIGYKYDSDGMRVSKTVNGVKSEYYYVGGKLYYEKRGSKELFYNYGNDGNLLRIRLSENGSDLYYYAACNMRGDVVALYKGDGGIKAEYKYDAWGKVLSVTDANGNEITDTNNIGLLNPIRYRGYYYDAETGFYYLQSRYYDPEIGRFISVDGRISEVGGNILGYNMFAYCMNNPVNMFDLSGNWPKWIKAVAKWVNNNIIQPVKNFFFPSKQSNVVNASSHDTNRRPYTGKPGSTYTAPNGDSRTYGPDGNPKHDYDHNDHGRPDKHPHDSNGGHNHDWKNGVRGPAYSIGWEPIAGVALVTVCVIGIVVVAADDATGIGIADDFLFGPLGAGLGEGLILIFG